MTTMKMQFLFIFCQTQIVIYFGYTRGTCIYIEGTIKEPFIFQKCLVIKLKKQYWLACIPVIFQNSLFLNTFY